jgi:(2Fe-2S) ferredoxin
MVQVEENRARIAPIPMETNDPVPAMEPYRHHLLVCTGSYCSPVRGGRRLYAMLPALLQREGLLFGPGRVKRGETPCLGVCTSGPIVVVYPEGIWYSGVTPELLEKIVVEHLKGGRVVEEAVFFRHGSGEAAGDCDRC